MKYYCIEPATKDKDGVAVLPTMGKPRWRDTGSSSAYERKMQFQKEEFKWDAHIRSLEKFPTSCDRVGWFEATEKHEGFSYSFSHEMGERAKWEVITKEEYEKARPTYRRKFIVPQSEEKDEPKTYTESEVREIVGRTWEAAELWCTDYDRYDGDISKIRYPDKETFINGLFPPQNQNNDKKI
jgi:hypothetical protein